MMNEYLNTSQIHRPGINTHHLLKKAHPLSFMPVLWVLRERAREREYMIRHLFI